MKNTKDVSGTGTDETGTGYELYAKYAQDALKVAFGYSNAKTKVVATPSDVTTKSMILGATYDLGAAKLAAQYASVKNDDNLAAASSTKATGYSLGAYVPVNAAATVYVQYSGAKDEGTNTDAKSTGYAVGVKYDLSKATFVYVDFGGTKKDHSTKGAGTAGLKASQYALGIVQSF
jgi:predicted porin